MENEPVRDKEFYLNSGNLKDGQHGRRSEFRRYLEKTGTLDKITEILMELYEYPALNLPVLEYMRKRLTDTNPDEEKLAELRPALKEAKLLRDHLAKENHRLRAKADELEFGGGSVDDEEAEMME